MHPLKDYVYGRMSLDERHPGQVIPVNLKIICPNPLGKSTVRTVSQIPDKGVAEKDEAKYKTCICIHS